jgi:hypothetical protein
MKVGLLIVSAILLVQTALTQTTTPLEITTHSGTDREVRAKEQIERLLKEHKVDRYIFTKKIIIQQDVVPHSHPVLTLSTRHIFDDELALSTFVHEQIHWWLEGKKETDAAIEELKKLYPEVPKEKPDSAKSEYSTYLHLIVCFLEGSALRSVYGEFKAWQVMAFWRDDHYRWVYDKVIRDSSAIAAVLRKHQLFPPQK